MSCYQFFYWFPCFSFLSVSGAGHGLSAILQMLLCFPSFLKSDTSAEKDVRACVDYLKDLFFSDGNTVRILGEAMRSEENELIHWCHDVAGQLP